jgi:hypothetical protein
MKKEKNVTKPITLRLPTSVLNKIEKYSVTPASFIKEAISAHLATREKEELIHAYAKAVQNTKKESKAINEESFAASAVAHNDED